MKLNKALFCLAIICITTTLADYRHFPDRSNMFSEGRHSRSSPFLRRLASTDNNSHDGFSAYNKTDPVTVRLQGTTELGYYYVTLFFGSPVQKQTLIVDTGSVTTTIPCTECGDDCGKNHFDSPFNHKNSESFEEFKCDESFGAYSCYDCANQCPFSVSYVEGSSYSGHFNKDFLVFGNEIEDNFSILNQIITNDSSTQNDKNKEIRESVEELIEKRKVFMPFGCTNRETKLFYEQEADGILGLGVNTNTYSSPPNLLDALHLQDPKFSRAFSLCLAQDGGYFTMGGYNAAYHVPEEKTHYTSYSDTFGQYKVYLHKIEMDGEDVGLKPVELNHGEGAFFDSGTTLTHVPSATYNGIRNKLHNHCQAGGSNCGNNLESSSFCWKYDQTVFPTLTSFYKTFPTFNFIFGKEKHAEYEWKAEDYLYLKDDEENVHCLGLAHYERETILGGTFMKNHDILFDKDKKRIGFVRANCNGVQEITKPLYMEKQEKPVETIKAGENSSPSGDVILNTETVSSHKMETVIIASVVSALVFAVVGGIGLLYVRAKRRRTAYQTMNNRRNIRIEIPSAGFSEQNLDMSGAETPQSSKEQAPQDEKEVARDEPSVDDEEDRSPKIRIDGDV